MSRAAADEDLSERRTDLETFTPNLKKRCVEFNKKPAFCVFFGRAVMESRCKHLDDRLNANVFVCLCVQERSFDCGRSLVLI